MRLLLDLGNTRLKWAVQSPSQPAWLAHGALEWHQATADALSGAWAGLPLPLHVQAASVVDAAREASVADAVARAFGRVPSWVRTPAYACGVRNAYADPQRLGVDRFLAMVAALAAGHAPCVTVSMGTAITLDALTADGTHRGGLIAPSPRLMQQAVFAATARVHAQSEGLIVDRADNTADAVASGCWHAAAALVERFVLRAFPAGSCDARLLDARLLIDGGDADRLLPLLDLPALRVYDSVLRGLMVWSDAQMRGTPSG